MEYGLVLPGAYLLGSISWGLIIGRATRGIDVRRYGSGNTGATNVLRTLGPLTATLVLLADTFKGVAAVILAKLLSDAPLAEALAGLLVVVGHNWPVFSRFRGGKGMTAAVGALVLMAPLATVAGAVAFVSAIALTRYVSLGSVLAVVVAMIAVPVLAAMGADHWEYVGYTITGGPMILWRHRSNIRRLLDGTERRLSFGRDRPSRNPS